MTYKLFLVGNESVETDNEIAAQQRDYVDEMQKISNKYIYVIDIEDNLEEWDSHCKEIIKDGQFWRYADHEGGERLNERMCRLADEKVKELDSD